MQMRSMPMMMPPNPGGAPLGSPRGAHSMVLPGAGGFLSQSQAVAHYPHQHRLQGFQRAGSVPALPGSHSLLPSPTASSTTAFSPRTLPGAMPGSFPVSPSVSSGGPTYPHTGQLVGSMGAGTPFAGASGVLQQPKIGAETISPVNSSPTARSASPPKITHVRQATDLPRFGVEVSPAQPTQESATKPNDTQKADQQRSKSGASKPAPAPGTMESIIHDFKTAMMRDGYASRDTTADLDIPLGTLIGNALAQSTSDSFTTSSLLSVRSARGSPCRTPREASAPSLKAAVLKAMRSHKGRPGSPLGSSTMGSLPGSPLMASRSESVRSLNLSLNLSLNSVNQPAPWQQYKATPRRNQEMRQQEVAAAVAQLQYEASTRTDRLVVPSGISPRARIRSPRRARTESADSPASSSWQGASVSSATAAAAPAEIAAGAAVASTGGSTAKPAESPTRRAQAAASAVLAAVEGVNKRLAAHNAAVGAVAPGSAAASCEGAADMAAAGGQRRGGAASSVGSQASTPRGSATGRNPTGPQTGEIFKVRVHPPDSTGASAGVAWTTSKPIAASDEGSAQTQGAADPTSEQTMQCGQPFDAIAEKVAASGPTESAWPTDSSEQAQPILHKWPAPSATEQPVPADAAAGTALLQPSAVVIQDPERLVPEQSLCAAPESGLLQPATLVAQGLVD